MLKLPRIDRRLRIEILALSIAVVALWLALGDRIASPNPESTDDLMAKREEFVRLTGDRGGFLKAISGDLVPTFRNDSERPVRLDLKHHFLSRDLIIARVEEIAASGARPEECGTVASAIFEFVSRNRRHSYPLFWGDMLHSPASFFTTYGSGFCDDAAMAMVEIGRWFGIPGRTVWVGELPSRKGIHVIAELYCDGEWGIYDPDLSEVIRRSDGRPVTFSELAALAQQSKIKWAKGGIIQMYPPEAEAFDASRQGDRGDPWGVLLPGEQRFNFDSPFFITSDGMFPEQRAWNSRAEVLHHYAESANNFLRLIPLRPSSKTQAVYVDDYFPLVAAFIRTKANELPSGIVTLIGEAKEKAIDISALKVFRYEGYTYVDLTPTLPHLTPIPAYSLRLNELRVGDTTAELLTVHLYSRFGATPAAQSGT